MTEYKCGNCREILVLSPKARFCPECGSSSLNLIIKELKEPAQKETLGVYSPQMVEDAAKNVLVSGSHYSEIVDTEIKQEEDQPRRPRRSR